MDPMDTIGRVSRQEPIRFVLVVFIGSNPFPPSRYPKKTLGHEMLDVRHRFVTTPVKMMPQGGGRGRTGGWGGGGGLWRHKHLTVSFELLKFLIAFVHLSFVGSRIMELAFCSFQNEI